MLCSVYCLASRFKFALDRSLHAHDIIHRPIFTCVWSRTEPSDVGMVTLSAFLQFWGVVFLATTVFVCFFKPEVEDAVDEKVLGLVDTYKQVKYIEKWFRMARNMNSGYCHCCPML